ncbi:MAG TPA: DnaB-like helicase C-terminal domain-containing protein, partial [Bacillota bacterium]|nr:DnaB-like helicase C-terminal domain-containing protein [Bacillota bacterium]
MAKIRTKFVCSECGSESPKWMGKCPECGQWNTLVEEVEQRDSQAQQSFAGILSKPESLLDISEDIEERLSTGSYELDRVLGGGIVKGSLVLVGGDPGIGKSTLLLQIANNIGNNGKKVL